MFGIELAEVIAAIGVLGVTLIIFAESGLLIGFFFPGDTLLFATGLLAHNGGLGLDIHLIVLLLIAAAIAGVEVGYWFGQKFGRKLFDRPDSWLFHKKNLERAEKFYEKYGPITLVLARFTPVVRTFAPIVAGIGNMNRKRFVFYNVVGAIFWITSVTYLGYYLGNWLETNGIDVELLVAPVIVAVIILSLASPLYHYWHSKRAKAD